MVLLVLIILLCTLPTLIHCSNAQYAHNFLRLLWVLERANAKANNNYFHNVAFLWVELRPDHSHWSQYDWRTHSFPIDHKRMIFIDLSLIGMGGGCLHMICLVSCLNSLPLHVGTITMCSTSLTCKWLWCTCYTKYHH